MLPNFYRKLGKLFICIAVLVNVGILITTVFSTKNASKAEPQKISKKVKIAKTTAGPIVDSEGRIDWHDYEFMAYERNRTGPGK